MNKNDQIKRWVKTWKKAQSSLHSIRVAELRDENYYLKNREILNSMLQYAFDHHKIRYHSGLVDQQKFFKQYYLQRLNHSR